MLGLTVVLGALLALLDTSAGQRFLIDRIEQHERDNGLTIRIGRIDGSIYSDPVLRDMRLGDAEGQFLSLSEARIEWQPWDFLLRRRLSINTLVVPRARLERLPRLRETDDDQPILPDFDIALRRLRVERIDIADRIAGRAHVGTIVGDADVRAGSATVHLDARLRDGGDRLRVALVARPDQGDFDVDADLAAPANGVLGAMLGGAEKETSAIIRGAGNWANWRGVLLARSDRTALASVRLGARNGRLMATGRLWPHSRLSGVPARLSEGGISLDLAGEIAVRRWNGRASLVSDVAQMEATGGADLAAGRWAGMRVETRLRRGDALVDGLTGEAVRAAILLDGDWEAPRYEYRLEAAMLALGKVRLSGAEARGAGTMRRAGFAVPLSLRIGRIAGVSPVLDRHLSAFRAEGSIDWRQGAVSGDAIRLTASGLTGRLGIRVAPQRRGARSDLTLTLDAAVPGLELAKLGRVDLVLNARGGRAGDASFAFSGTARAALRRFDNPFLRGVAGGLPSAAAGFSIGGDRVLRLSDVRLSAPLITLAGAGQRLNDGSYRISARGSHRRYGPVDVALAGRLERPHIVIDLAAPFAAGDLSNVRLLLEPDARGFTIIANGGSLLGPFTANGQLLLPAGRGAILNVERLSVGGTRARGQLGIGGGGLFGQLLVAGGGLDGQVVMSVPAGHQRIIASLTARNAHFVGPPSLTIARGQLQANIVLNPAGSDIDATFETVGLSRGRLSIARMAGNARLVNGAGTLRMTLAGSRGRDFTFQAVADVTADRWTVRGDGSLAQQPLRLVRPAVVTRIDGGWALAPTEFTYAGGRVQLSGQMVRDSNRIQAGLDAIPLSLLDMGWPDLGLGGRASGRLNYSDEGGLPSGAAQLRVRGLTRAGLVDMAAPVDVAVNAVLSAGGASARAVIERQGNVIGRAQARLSPLDTSGPLLVRLAAAPMFAQLRYDGEAGTLWRMTGVENLSFAGRIAIAADVGGTLNAPAIRGVVRAHDMRVESLQTGTVVSAISASGQFDGSRLRLRDIRGTTSGGGSIAGAGDIDFALSSNLAMDIRLDATRALLIDRDDLVARVSGPVRLLRDASGGMISGQLQLDAGRFRLGRATAVDALPVINVVETNVPADRPVLRARYLPWRLNLAITGRDGFNVTGLGIDSHWSTDVAVRGDVSNFSIAGQARLVRGDYVFAGRRFALESGVIRFDGSTPADPALDIVAVDDVAGIDASIRVRGTGLRPEISFTSVPALPEDELLSRILFGSSITDISVTEAAQLGLALAALRDGGDGLDPINALRRATGLDRLRILPADSELGAGTAIAAGKYVTRRIYVEVITDGRGYSATRAEYQITRWLALLGSISTLGRESVNVRIQRDY